MRPKGDSQRVRMGWRLNNQQLESGLEASLNPSLLSNEATYLFCLLFSRWLYSLPCLSYQHQEASLYSVKFFHSKSQGSQELSIVSELCIYRQQCDRVYKLFTSEGSEQ